MSRGLIALNALFTAAILVAAGYIVRELRAPAPVASTPVRPGGPAAVAVLAPPPPPIPGAYGVIASRNLFSPSRSEAPTTPLAGGSAVPLVKPNLFGVVLKDGAPLAYLEDPTTKRVSGYRLGDSIAGGSLQTIEIGRASCRERV